jgi:hypothetical protein
VANIAPVPIVLNDIVLNIGTDNYEAAVSKAELVPTTPVAKWKGMAPTAVHQLVGSTEWMLNLDFAQDHATANSLSQYLLTNSGTQKEVTLKPKKGTTTAPTYKITATLIPSSIGGSVDQVAVASVSLPCIGQPVRSVA